MLQNRFMLKNNELCLVGSPIIRDSRAEAGLYLRDTRFLSGLDVRLNDTALDVLAVRHIADHEIEITAVNPKITVDGTELRESEFAIRQRLRLGRALELELIVESYHAKALNLTLSVEVSADFRDMFEVRGMTASEHPALTTSLPENGQVSFYATDSTGSSMCLEMHFGAELVPDRPAENEGRLSVLATQLLTLDAGSTLTTGVTIKPVPVGTEPREAIGAGFLPVLHIQSSDPVFDGFIRQCDRDLALLYTDFPEGALTGAGVPWYMVPFGRDSIIVALQTLHVYPERSASTLRVMASLQGTKDDPFREEQPGKIPHEMRYGAMARTGQIPHTPYYGSIDATPLFVMAFAEHDLWHPDDALWSDLLPNVKRALEWIERTCESGGGYLRFGGTALGQSHISQQGWKDSFDSLHFADGREVEGPVALVEPQGYVFAAYAWLAERVRAHGDQEWADQLAARAEAMRALVEDNFWDEVSGFYAQAIDGHGQRIDNVSSNPGHLLWCGLPSPERAAKVATHLDSPEMLTSWGIRTLSSAMATYNPTSYHNGSVWPHDTSLAMAGLARYGHDELATEIALRLARTSRFDPDQRLDELYCGYDEHPEAGPIAYPVSCRPQAWAAGAGLLALRCLLGLKPDGTATPSPVFRSRVSSLEIWPFTARGEQFSVSI